MTARRIFVLLQLLGILMLAILGYFVGAGAESETFSVGVLWATSTWLQRVLVVLCILLTALTRHFGSFIANLGLGSTFFLMAAVTNFAPVHPGAALPPLLITSMVGAAGAWLSKRQRRNGG